MKRGRISSFLGVRRLKNRERPLKARTPASSSTARLITRTTVTASQRQAEKNINKRRVKAACGKMRRGAGTGGVAPRCGNPWAQHLDGHETALRPARRVAGLMTGMKSWLHLPPRVTSGSARNVAHAVADGWAVFSWQRRKEILMDEDANYGRRSTCLHEQGPRQTFPFVDNAGGEPCRSTGPGSVR